MKKMIYAIFALFMIAACSKENSTFAGNEYKMLNTTDNAEITLGFDGKDSRFFGVAAINRYFGTYKTAGNNLTFGPAGSTMMAGPENLMKAESAYLQFLPEVKTFKIDGDKLILSNKDGKEVVFEKIGALKMPE